jgi:4-hydroxybenzoate polyprenyltransferase
MVKALAELLRVRQWVKNGFVLAPLFFGAQFANPTAVSRAAIAVVIFCLISSAVYIFNDWCDIELDRYHVKKAQRPLPSGRVTVPLALAIMAALIITAVVILYFTRLPKAFAETVAIYVAINILYSLGLKHVSIVELFLVASGFVIRLIGGAYAIQIWISPWIIIATGMLSLLVAAGKRRGDIAQENDESRKRKSLADYNIAFLDSMLAAMTGGTIVVYLLFCVSDYAVGRFGEGVIITSIPVALGLLRYLQLIIVQGHGESPTDLVLGDSGMLAILAAFGVAFAILIYF